MKKRNRRILSLTVAIMMLLLTVLPSSAAAVTLTPIVQTPAALTRILSAYPELSVASFKPLYSPANEITAYYYMLSPTGYAIVSVQGEVVEWSPTAIREIPANQTVYYAGPLSYFIKSGASYVDVYSGEAYSAAVMTAQYAQFASTAQAYAAPSDAAPAGIVLPEVDGTYTNWTSYIPDPTVHDTCTCSYTGICGSIATAMYLMYYNDYICPGIIPSGVGGSSANSLVHYLLAYIERDGIGVGSSTSDVVTGINEFIVHHHYTSTYLGYYATSDDYLSFSEYVSHIVVEDRPIIIDLDNAPTYGEHWIVGYGYSETIENGIVVSQYFIVCDGWGSSNVYISPSFVDDGVYITN